MATQVSSQVTETGVKEHLTTGIVGMWNGTTDGKEDALVDYKTGSTNVKPPIEVEIVVRDLRTVHEPINFHTKGFGLIDHTTSVTAEEFLNGQTPEGTEIIREKYFPEIKEVIERITGAKKVLPYTFRIRQQSIKPSEFGNNEMAVAAVPIAHTDRDRITGKACVINNFGAEEAERLFKKYKRFAQVNIWRPIGQTVRRWPLLLIDCQKVPNWDYDTHLAKVHVDNDPRVAVGSTIKTHDCVLKHDPRYKYYYASDLRVDEALIFTSFDSDVSKICPHGAFWDNETTDDAPIRRSIDVRTWAFFDPIDGEE
jgi:hypothetical protein